MSQIIWLYSTIHESNIQSVDRSSKELYKMKDFNKQKGAETKKLY